ncbi:SNF8 protein, partial [Toxostoma redivivum]|nr:SNF8 protein [Toxostoma redivivum]
QAKYKERGTVLAEDQLAQMSKQLETFRTHLEAFASKHKQEIRKSPAFRLQFQDMCATIGVDPLACEGQGFGIPAGILGKGWGWPWGGGWSSVAFGVPSLSLFLSHSCLITLEELQQQVLKGRGKFAQDVSQDDLLRAIKKLKVLGSGFGIIPVGGTFLVQSVPAELNMDHTVVLQLAEVGRAGNGWEFIPSAPISQDHLLKEGMAWLDAQAPAEPQFWFPALFPELHGQDGAPE